MDKLISVDKLIKKAEQQKINFGKGDPYNRLRYYTKIGWLPHMVRKKEASGEVKGHYPESALDTLIYIENLKATGLTNDQIQSKLDSKKSVSTFKTSLMSRSLRNKIVIVILGAVLITVVGTELGFIKVGALKTNSYRTNAPTQLSVDKVIASGNSFIPQGQKKVFIPVKDITATGKVVVTFSQDYFPATRYWISEIKQGNGFTLELDTTPQNDAGFSWWAIE
jgi:hypothetical protein